MQRKREDLKREVAQRIEKIDAEKARLKVIVVSCVQPWQARIKKDAQLALEELGAERDNIVTEKSVTSFESRAQLYQAARVQKAPSFADTHRELTLGATLGNNNNSMGNSTPGNERYSEARLVRELMSEMEARAHTACPHCMSHSDTPARRTLCAQAAAV